MLRGQRLARALVLLARHQVVVLHGWHIPVALVAQRLVPKEVPVLPCP
jgi:hypothetical protein